MVSMARVNLNYRYEWCTIAGEGAPLTMGWRCPTCTARWHVFLVDPRQQEEGAQRGMHIPVEVAVHIGGHHVTAHDAALGGNLENGHCNQCMVMWIPLADDNV